MGLIYETVRNIETAIARKGLPGFKTKGLIAIKVGFSLSLINQDTPDDASKVAALQAAAREVLGDVL